MQSEWSIHTYYIRVNFNYKLILIPSKQFLFLQSKNFYNLLFPLYRTIITAVRGYFYVTP